MNKEPRTVGIGQLAICHSPEQLACLGLGSCVAVILYDPGYRTGGIVHVLLPKAPNPCDAPEKYADTGTNKLVHEILVNGAKKERLVAKLVGGAQMFKNLNISISDIGKQNCMQARKVLRDLSIKVVAEDLEGERGRSVFFDSATGKVVVTKAFSPTRII